MKNLNQPSFRLLIVNDHALTREGLLALFQTAKDLDVLACGAAEAVWLTRRFVPDVVLIDVASSDIESFDAGSFETAGSILSRHPASRVVFLDDTLCPAHIYKTLAVRGHGYWTKFASFPQIVEAVRRVAAGGVSFCPAAWRYVSQSPEGRRFDGAGSAYRNRHDVPCCCCRSTPNPNQTETP